MGSRIESGALERLSPFRFLSFSFPNPHPDPYSDCLRVAVLHSPLPPLPSQPPAIAAMVVPFSHEHDWIFSTPAGYLQLLLSSPLSRLVLVGDSPPASPRPTLAPDRILIGTRSSGSSRASFPSSLLSFLGPPSGAASRRSPSSPSKTKCCLPMEALASTLMGEMLVEDVEIDRSPVPSERQRRLRFRRKPNLV